MVIRGAREQGASIRNSGMGREQGGRMRSWASRLVEGGRGSLEAAAATS